MATMTAQAFNRDVSAAKRLAEEDGPLFITHRGEIKFVLMTIEEYRQIKPRKSLREIFRADDDIDLDSLIPPRTIWPARDLDLFE